VVVEDLRTENRLNGPPLLLEHGVVSGISTIIHVSGHAYGVLGAHTKRKRVFADQEVDFLKDVADPLSVAIERRQTEEAIRRVRAASGLTPPDSASCSSPRPTRFCRLHGLRYHARDRGAPGGARDSGLVLRRHRRA
jgi:hypothetical protein